MLIGRYDDPAARAGIDVDVRVNAALADEPKRIEPFKQRLPNRRAFADQNEDLGAFETLGKGVDILRMIGPDRDLVSVQLAKARERAKRVEIIIENRYLHRMDPSYSTGP